MIDGSSNAIHSGFYAAAANGYFEEENIEVEISTAPANGSDALVGAGSANFGISTQDRIANNLGSESPLPYTAIAAVVQHNTSGFMSPAELDVASPGQLQGLRYATKRLPVEQGMVNRLVSEDGVDPATVTMVSYSEGTEVSGLADNSFDCVWVYDWWSVSEANLDNYPVSFLPLRNLGAVFDYYSPVIVVNDQFAADNPDTVKAFLRALKRGYEFAASDPDAAAGILVDSTIGMDADLAYLAQSYLSGEYIEDAPEWGVIDAGRWSAFNQWLIDEGLVSYAFDPADGFTMEYFEE